MKQEAHTTARERILETANRLFYAHGVRATGVDRIIAESGVAKMSFYRNFASKKDLVRAFLERRHGLWMGWFKRRVVELEKTHPGHSLSVMAEALREWFEEADFRGCAFINIALEVRDLDADEHSIARSHKQDLGDFIQGRLASTTPERAEEIAQLALLILDGAIVRAQITGSATAAQEAGILLSLLEQKMRGEQKNGEAL
jgi:AcrR family transcriptional regulator